MSVPTTSYSTPYLESQLSAAETGEPLPEIVPARFVRRAEELEIEKTTARIFHHAIQTAADAMKESNVAPTVTVHEVPEYAAMKALFLSKDFCCGAALDVNNIISVFKHPKGPPGAAEKFLPHAIREGGKRLDCFNINGALPYLYSKFGFYPVAKLPFNPDPDVAPKGWDCSLHGTPDLIFMALRPETELTNPNLGREERLKKVEEIIKNLEYSSNWDEAEEIQKQFVNE